MCTMAVKDRKNKLTLEARPETNNVIEMGVSYLKDNALSYNSTNKGNQYSTTTNRVKTKQLPSSSIEFTRFGS